YMQEKEFSTFDVGKICNVAHTTVINWIERKELAAHSTPGGHRRVYHNDFLAFLKKYNMRVPPELLEAEKNPGVLIVDDDAEILVMLSRAFKEHAPEFKVLTTQNGMEALMIVGREPPAVIILDVVMPDMDGLAVCKTLKAGAASRHIKVLVITGKRLTGEQRGYFLETVDGIFRKPFSAVKLVERAVQALKE
ncbi:MAG: response regulator, partial [Elusimicrobia bacterium]|nr:response regulator [Elusimicrobiota bacterium]